MAASSKRMSSEAFFIFFEHTFIRALISGFFGSLTVSCSSIGLGWEEASYINENRRVGRQVVYQAGGRLTGSTAGEVARIVFGTGAKAELFQHVKVMNYPNFAKAGGLQNQGANSEAVVIYCESFATQVLETSGFPEE